MKLLILATAALLLPSSLLFGQTKTVLKTPATDALIESLKVPTGKALTIQSGATLTVEAGATLNGISASTAWADITGKPTFAAVATTGAYADLSGTPNLTDYLTTVTAATTYQPLATPLTNFANLANASGVLTNNGAGSLSYLGFTGTGSSLVKSISPTLSGPLTWAGPIIISGTDATSGFLGLRAHSVVPSTPPASGFYFYADSLHRPTILTPNNTSRMILNTDAGTVTGNMMADATIDLTTKVTGILPNANTTATNANTASAIVARDGSGNFTAGTITAALTGVASGNEVPLTFSTGLTRTTNTITVAADAGLPSQTGNSGKYLTTNGTVSSWATVTGGVTSITGTANEITVTGTTTPTLSLPSALTFTGKTLTGGTYTGAALNGTLGATTPNTVAGTTGTWTGVQTLPNGAVGAPALNLGDATTGLYRSAANAISVATAGVKALTVDSSWTTIYASADNGKGLFITPASGWGGSKDVILMFGDTTGNASLRVIYNSEAIWSNYYALKFTAGINSGAVWLNKAYADSISYGASFDVTLGRDAAAVMQQGADAATATHQAIKAHDGSGTDKAGANYTFAGGQATGTGRGGDVLTKTSNVSTTSSALQSYSTRRYDSAKAVTLTESTATTFANIGVAASKYAGARLVCTVTANDGTDYQCLTSHLTVDATNKAGTVTATLVQADGITAASAGTLTVTYTAVANGATVDIKANAVSSLTQTTLTAKWSVISLNSDGADTSAIAGSLVTPQ